MKKKISKKRKGALTIEALFLIFVVMLIIALSIRIYPVFIIKHKLDTFSEELCRECEIKGTVGGAVIERISELKESLLVPDEIVFDGSELYKGSKIQLDGKIIVKTTYEYDIGLKGIGSYIVKLESISTGKSEVFWRWKK